MQRGASKCRSGHILEIIVSRTTLRTFLLLYDHSYAYTVTETVRPGPGPSQWSDLCIPPKKLARVVTWLLLAFCTSGDAKCWTKR